MAWLIYAVLVAASIVVGFGLAIALAVSDHHVPIPFAVIIGVVIVVLGSTGAAKIRQKLTAKTSPQSPSNNT